MAQASGAQTDRQKWVHQTQVSPWQERCNLFLRCCFLPPFQRARAENKEEKAERVSWWNRPTAQNEKARLWDKSLVSKKALHKKPTLYTKSWGEIISLRRKLNGKRRNEKILEDVSKNIHRQQLLREGFNALQKGRGWEKGKAQSAAEPPPATHHLAWMGQDMQDPHVPAGHSLWHHVYSFPAWTSSWLLCPSVDSTSQKASNLF